MDDAPVKKEPMPSGIRPPNDLEAGLARITGRTLSGDDDLSHGGDGGLGGLSAAQMAAAAAAAAAASNPNAVSQLVNSSFSAAGMSGSRSPLSAGGYHDEGSLLALAAAAAAGSHGGAGGAGAGGPNEPKFYEWDSMRMTQKMLQHSPSDMNHAGDGSGVDHDASLGSDEASASAAEAAAQAHKQSLRTLEKLLLSPHGASVAAAMGGDVAAAAAALANAGSGAGLDPSALGSIADVHTLSQHAMAIFQQQQQQQQQQQPSSSSTTPNSGTGILPSMATFVGNSASSLQRRYKQQSSKPLSL